MPSDATVDPASRERAISKATRLNQIAGRNFNTGLRAIFFALAYLGWFLGPYALIVSTILVVAIIAKRQYYSAARDAVSD